MKCLHFTNSLDLGGTSKTLQIFCQELLHLGHTPVVFCREEGPRADFLRKSGIAVHAVADWQPFIETALTCDVVHLHTSGKADNELADALENVRSSNPKIRIIATNVFGGYDARLHSLTDKQLMVSNTLLLKFLKHHPELIDSERYASLHNPIDTKELTRFTHSEETMSAFKKSLDIPDDSIILGRIARPDILKWDPLLEKVISGLAARKVPFTFLFMSAPPSVERKLKKSRYAQYCRFIQPSPEESEVVKFYQTIDILVHSSSIGETFGCTLAEAMYMEKPIVVRSTPFTSRHLFRDNAQIELVDHGKIGYCSDTVAGLLSAIETLSRDSVQQKQFGKAGRKKVLAQYASTVLTKLLVDIYQGHHPGLLANASERARFAQEYDQRLRASTTPDNYLHAKDTLYTLYRTVQNRLIRQ